MYLACKPIERVKFINCNEFIDYDGISIWHEFLQDAVQLEIEDIHRMISEGFVFLSMNSKLGDFKRYMNLNLKPIVVLKRFSSLKKEYGEYVCEKIETPDKCRLF